MVWLWQAKSDSGRRGDASTRLVLLIVCAGVVLASLDLFIVNVALPDIARELGTSGTWPTCRGCSTPTRSSTPRCSCSFGRLAERRARAERLPARRRDLHRRLGGVRRRLQPADARRLPDPPGRRRGAADADVAQPRPGDHRRRSAGRARCARGRRSAALAAALGPVVGGLLVAAQLALGVLRQRARSASPRSSSAGGGCRRCPATPCPRPDALGAALVTAGVGAAARSGLVKGERLGLGLGADGRHARGRRGGAAACSSLHCLRARNPLIDPSLFRIRAFTGASIVAIVFSIAFGAMLLSVVLWLQDVWGWSALQTGLASPRAR